jgi:hypothetical protein
MAKKEFVPFLGGRSAEHLNFTRDRRWVTYVAYPEGTLWRARSDGSQQLQLTFPPLLARNPRGLRMVSEFSSRLRGLESWEDLHDFR